MRYIAILTGLVLVAAAPACAAELEVRSSTDMVTVYPDGATITRLIRVELPAGDTTLIARDFPPGLDPASLRVCRPVMSEVSDPRHEDVGRLTAARRPGKGD